MYIPCTPERLLGSNNCGDKASPPPSTHCNSGTVWESDGGTQAQILGYSLLMFISPLLVW